MPTSSRSRILKKEMPRNPAKILSASRRTDIPAFYLDWFMKRIRSGTVPLQNPFNGHKRNIDLQSENIRGIVFWSKNFDVFLRSGSGETLQKMGYHLFFNFTINSPDPILEPRMTPLPERLAQLKQLADLFGPEHIDWRFDPICFYRMEKQGKIKNNLRDFEPIAEAAHAAGITRCVTSFCDAYTKIKRRIRDLSLNEQHFSAFELIVPPLEKKITLVGKMARLMNRVGMDLGLCCEKEVFDHPGLPENVFSNACIDGKRLSRITGVQFETRKDYGQRRKQGCGCTQAIDVGNYAAHPCRHNCLFCYANPMVDTQMKEIQCRSKT